MESEDFIKTLRDVRISNNEKEIIELKELLIKNASLGGYFCWCHIPREKISYSAEQWLINEGFKVYDYDHFSYTVNWMDKIGSREGFIKTLEDIRIAKQKADAEKEILKLKELLKNVALTGNCWGTIPCGEISHSAEKWLNREGIKVSSSDRYSYYVNWMDKMGCEEGFVKTLEDIRIGKHKADVEKEILKLKELIKNANSRRVYKYNISSDKLSLSAIKWLENGGFKVSKYDNEYTISW